MNKEEIKYIHVMSLNPHREREGKREGGRGGVREGRRERENPSPMQNRESSLLWRANVEMESSSS